MNLTTASRAYLMEPHWNPTVEEQALARIHRLGQMKEVTTIRYIMDDTVEKVCVDFTVPLFSADSSLDCY